MNDNRKKLSLIMSVCFLAMMFGALAGSILIPDRSFSADENRSLQRLPAFRLSEYFDGRFETALEHYVDDQFPFRNSFIKIKTAADRTMGKLENNGVYRARSGYLMEDITVPSEKTIREDQDALRHFASKHDSLNMYFILVPNAANIFSDELPLTVRPGDQNAPMDRIFKSVRKDGMTPIDVRETFKKKKDDIQLYYRTDHHWTTDGAYTAYQYASPKLGNGAARTYAPYIVKNDFKGTLYSKSGFTNGLDDEIRIYLPTDEKSYKKSVIYYADTQKKTTEFYQTGNLKKKDAYTVFGGSNHPMYTIETPVESSKRLLIIKDSYANCFIPFLTQNYREIVVVDPRYYFDNLDDLISSENITDVLFLYNANTFFSDHSLSIMLSGSSQ